DVARQRATAVKAMPREGSKAQVAGYWGCVATVGGRTRTGSAALRQSRLEGGYWDSGGGAGGSCMGALARNSATGRPLGRGCASELESSGKRIVHGRKHCDRRSAPICFVPGWPVHGFRCFGGKRKGRVVAAAIAGRTGPQVGGNRQRGFSILVARR